MTRLKSADIEHLSAELNASNERLRLSLGISLAELACRGAGVAADAAARTRDIRVAVVPVTSGEGVITHFSETVAAIAAFLGFSAEVTVHSDIAGIAEAYQKQFDIILTSDDDVFCAINIKRGQVFDNSECTGRGFAHGLDGLAGGLAGKPVLVLGCGPVGQAGVRALVGLGGRVTVYDPDRQRCQTIVEALPEAGILVAANPQEGLAGHSLIFEATPVANVVGADAVTRDTCVAAPGVPCGMSDEAVAILGPRLLWDPLQTGVATMLMAAAFATERRMTEERPA